MFLMAEALAGSVTQLSGQEQHQHKSIGDPFLSRPADASVPVESSLALTHAFIYSGVPNSHKRLNVGVFEMDVFWIYVLIAIIVITSVVVGIICCCSGGGDKKEEMMEKKEDEKMMDEEKMGDDMMMEAPMEPPVEM